MLCIQRKTLQLLLISIATLRCCPVVAQDANFVMDGNRFLRLSGEGPFRGGMVTSYSPTEGFQHEPVTAASFEDQNRMTVNLGEDGPIQFASQETGTATSWYSISPSFGTEMVQIEDRKDPEAEEFYRDFLSSSDGFKNTIFGASKRLELYFQLCAENIESFEFCKDWSTTSQVGILLPTAQVGVVEIVASATEQFHSTMSIDGEESLVVTGASVIEAIARATGSNFRDEVIDV